MTKRNKWRGFAVAAVAAAWLAVPGAVQPASAALISGSFSIVGNDIWDINANTLGIVDATPAITTATGDFLPFVGTSLTFNQCTVGGGPCNYSTLAGLLYTGNNGLTFTISRSASSKTHNLPLILTTSPSLRLAR